jgi:hypothetical protein
VITFPIQGPVTGRPEGLPPEDNSGITVTISRLPSLLNPGECATFVTLKIPDIALIASKNKDEFMTWCAKELMKILEQVKGI